MSIFDKIKGMLGGKQLSPNDMVRANLHQHGDDGTKPRSVDHLAYFKNELDMETYLTFVQDRGYTINSSAEEFGVAFKKEASVVGQEFDLEIAILTVKATDLRGEYDGWGCPVTK